MISGSKRDHGVDKPPLDVKRARTSLDQDKPNASEVVPLVSYERLKNVPLPDGISALSHVLNLLDMLLMTPEEALSVAIETNDPTWVQQILDRFPCDYSEAMEQAAGLNRLDIVNLIISDIVKCSNEASMAINMRVDDERMYRVLKKGGFSAARNGHVPVLGRLLPLIIKDTDNCLPYWPDVVHTIFEEGAVHGQLSVVKFMIDFASTTWNSNLSLVDSLSKAIIAGHVHVAEFLLTLRDNIYRLEEAFVVAVDKGQIFLAERIRAIYGRHLFINVVRLGNVNAVEYLYNNGCNDSELVGLALANAATYARSDVVKFLVENGCISSKAFETAFENACFGYGYECIDIVMYLYKLNRASRQCIELGFTYTNSLAVVNFLFENEKISDQAITATFKRAKHHWYLDFILVLYKQPCIPSDLIEKLFLYVAKSLNRVYLGDKSSPKIQVMKGLQDDERVSLNTVGEAFLYTVQNYETNVVLFFYNKRRTPPEFLVKAFVEAAHRKKTGLVKEILKLLFVEEHVPRKFMHETFVAAARHGQMSILQHVCENLTADLPLEVLKTGLEAAGNDEVETFIRKMICDQVCKEHA
ncbi:hypothetical protein DVH05_000981 [Phytophthora capsici]|nr:hypothetical protein DVH05_000981 [Phytophthora capsici]